MIETGTASGAFRRASSRLLLSPRQGPPAPSSHAIDDDEHGFSVLDWDWSLSQHIAGPGHRRHKEHDPTREREGGLAAKILISFHDPNAAEGKAGDGTKNSAAFPAVSLRTCKRNLCCPMLAVHQKNLSLSSSDLRAEQDKARQRENMVQAHNYLDEAPRRVERQVTALRLNNWKMSDAKNKSAEAIDSVIISFMLKAVDPARGRLIAHPNPEVRECSGTIKVLPARSAEFARVASGMRGVCSWGALGQVGRFLGRRQVISHGHSYCPLNRVPASGM
ncbi:hypothetical protein BDP55DRAFT_720559 [Colletotrichum godetiae]|uniref:Uncharacterized protein n=1 Tax=Colletotrichum godetiae TaxID=1209918 RepID=A0AAJ0ABP3_9PEZI|nr:uncharacterized protein BDP55DRAFT_720559 [Colletotrichum godetiae]KAK1658631.1 hypothetical protein BDP55DRAFT_720559 [Colletotrichum godetiae]